MSKNDAGAAVAWIVGFAGVGLLIAAVKDRRPLGELAAALRGSTPDRTPTTPNLNGAAVAAPVASTPPASGFRAVISGAGGSGGPVPRSATVSVSTGAGTILLVPEAAASFQRVLVRFGAAIPCTSGWRDEAAQQAAHEANPSRFATGAGSFHTAGKAVDVDNVWLNRLSAADQSKLRRAFAAEGWRQARWKGEASCGSNPNNDTEPWHFSFGGCG